MANLQHLYETEKDYAKRLPILLGEIKSWIAATDDACTFSNGQITAGLAKLHSLGAGERRKLSRDISSAGRMPEAKSWVRPGPEKMIHGKMHRTRVWAMPGAPEGKTYVEPELLPRGKAEWTRDDMYAAARRLREHGWLTVSPAEQERGDVNPVDKPKVSRHPKPGFKQVTCGDCGGSGKVYIAP